LSKPQICVLLFFEGFNLLNLFIMYKKIKEMLDLNFNIDQIVESLKVERSQVLWIKNGFEND
jgi:hypothetical protein